MRARTAGHQRTTFATSKNSIDFFLKIYQQINSKFVKKITNKFETKEQKHLTLTKT
jgi:hypothetical protein